VELSLLELIRNRAANLETLSSRLEIEALKSVIAQTDAPKTRARALLAQVKRLMIEEGRNFARDEKTIADAWVKEAVVTYREQVMNKETKMADKRNGRPRRGLTIRDAYEAREAAGVGRRGNALSDDDDDDDDNENDDDCDEEDGRNDEACDGSENDNEEEGRGRLPSSSSAQNLMSQNVENIRQKVRQQAKDSVSRIDDPQRAARIELESRRLKNNLDAKRENSKYCELLATREILPAYAMRDQIVTTIRDNRVVVVSGDTGCGKTTQIPQLILDDLIMRSEGGECNIIVTQPRRISAISVAERIAQERCEKIGETAGYHIRLEAKKSAKTKILLMTTGVLLRKLQIEGELHGVTHVFVDEGKYFLHHISNERGIIQANTSFSCLQI